MSSPRCLELFAGAGGAALGIEAAGFAHAALCEWDPDACATLRAAGLGPVVEGDVRDLDVIEAVAGSGPLDLLWSSPPCQRDSTAGTGNGFDGWPPTLASIDRFEPVWFLGEAVVGSLRNGRADMAQKALRDRYAHVGAWVLDASMYGVPQSRRRVIHWAGPRRLTPPASTHGVIGAPAVSWGHALGLHGSISAAGRTGRCAPRPHTRPAPTITAKSTAWLEPAGRRLSMRECAALQGFPADHPFQGTDTTRRRLAGNAVPPTLARVVAARVYAELTDR